MIRQSLSNQTTALLRERIDQGIYLPDSALPSITDLAVELGVARTTVREALKQLEMMQLVSIQHGKGVFVSQPKIDFSTQLMSFSESIFQMGMTPGAVVIKNLVGPASAGVAEKLRIRAGEMVNHVLRLRLADGRPMAVENSYTPCSFFPGLAERQDLAGSLYDIFSKVYHHDVAYATRSVEAVLSGAEDNQLLEIVGRQPALLIETIALDREGRPLEYGRSLYRADRYKFVVQQKRG